jgi:hypothetical protein
MPHRPDLSGTRRKRSPLVVGANLSAPKPGTIVLPDGVAVPPPNVLAFPNAIVPPSATLADKERFLNNETALLMAKATEAALCRMVLILSGTEPGQEEITKRGTIVPGEDDSGAFEDFCWDGRPLLRRRVRFDSTAILFAIEPLG